MSHHTSSPVQARDPSSQSQGGSILSLLLDNLRSPNPRARALAVREVADYTDSVVVRRLLEMADRDPDLEVRCTVISALGNYMYLGSISDYDLETDEALACAEDCLADADFARVYDLLLSVYHDEGRTLDERRQAVESLSFYSNDTVSDLIAELYARPEKEAKLSALLAMGNSGAVRWEEDLRRALHDPDLDLQVEAIRAAGELAMDSLGKALWRLTYADNQDVVLAAVWALGQTGWDGAFERLDELTLHEDTLVSECADEALEEWLFYNGLAQEHDQEGIDRFLDE